MEQVKYQLECKHHFWNFDTKEEALEAAKVIHLCDEGFTIKQVIVKDEDEEPRVIQ